MINIKPIPDPRLALVRAVLSAAEIQDRNAEAVRQRALRSERAKS